MILLCLDVDDAHLENFTVIVSPSANSVNLTICGSESWTQTLSHVNTNAQSLMHVLLCETLTPDPITSCR